MFTDSKKQDKKSGIRISINCKRTLTMTKINKAIIYAHANAIGLLKSRKLKSLISSESRRRHTNEQILICDEKYAHGIVILNTPTILDLNQFSNQTKRHSITEELREAVWGNCKQLSSYNFRIKKIFKEPLEYVSDNSCVALGKFIDDVKIIDKHEEAVSVYKDKLEDIKKKASVEGKEDLKKMFEELYELFLKRYSEKNIKKMENINV